MARGKEEKQEGGLPAWLVTFSDLMTLLLTFFVLLMSMAVIDERTKREVLGSVAKEFGFESTIINPTAPQGSLPLLEPGRINAPPQDLEPLKDRVFDDSTQDLKFMENKFVQVFSINDEVFFLPGTTELSPHGKLLLNRLLPYLHRLEYPLLVAGHAGNPRDEEGTKYTVDFTKGQMDSTWLISYHRALSVYRHLVASGISPERVAMEGFGQQRAKKSDNPDIRKKNRRVDLVLDKRNRTLIDAMEASKLEKKKENTEYHFEGFRFNLKMP